MTSITFDSLESEYQRLWADVQVRPERKAAALVTARRIQDHRARYLAVTAETGVPWPMIGMIHAMECGLDFSRHLHNGDKLTERTWQQPKNRPAHGEPPFTWEESAVDALRFDKLDRCTDWTIPRLLFLLEGYNGWGYRRHHPDVLSPYLWSGTAHYSRGKYIADGKWNASAVSGQSGAAAILVCLIEIAPEVAATFGAGEAAAEQGALAFAKASVGDSVVASGRSLVGASDSRSESRPEAPVTAATLAAEGSRSMTLLQRLQASLAALGLSTAGLSTADSFGLAREWISGLKTLAADHAVVLVLGGIGAGGLVVYLAQHYLVAAARDGRYAPRGALVAPSDSADAEPAGRRG